MLDHVLRWRKSTHQILINPYPSDPYMSSCSALDLIQYDLFFFLLYKRSQCPYLFPDVARLTAKFSPQLTQRNAKGKTAIPSSQSLIHSCRALIQLGAQYAMEAVKKKFQETTCPLDSKARENSSVSLGKPRICDV